MQGPAIHVEQLSLTLGAVAILAPMSFTIESGNIHCLIGPNGGGKTSTLRCLLGQMPHQGRIRIDWHENRHCGYVPQLIEIEKTLPLTVRDFLTLLMQQKPAFLGTSNDTQQHIDVILEKTRFTDKQNLMLGSLSGGERQRLLFAQALYPDPALLILDEPMTSLDEAGMHNFEELILDFKAAGGTIIWVNHDLEQVSRLADQVTVIDRGLLAHGPTSSVIDEKMRQGIYRQAGAE